LAIGLMNDLEILEQELTNIGAELSVLVFGLRETFAKGDAMSIDDISYFRESWVQSKHRIEKSIHELAMAEGRAADRQGI
jgi:hypothetical protein